MSEDGESHKGGQDEKPKQVGELPLDYLKGVEAHKVLDFDSFRTQFEAAGQRDATATPEQQAETKRQLSEAGKLFDRRLTRLGFVAEQFNNAVEGKPLPDTVTSESVNMARQKLMSRQIAMETYRENWTKIFATTAGAGLVASAFGLPEGIYITGGLLAAEGAGLVVSETIWSRALLTQQKLRSLGVALKMNLSRSGKQS
jgi:hypothetical protein